jgi:hypothetical protein
MALWHLGTLVGGVGGAAVELASKPCTTTLSAHCAAVQADPHKSYLWVVGAVVGGVAGLAVEHLSS